MRKITFLVACFFILLQAATAQENNTEKRGRGNGNYNGHGNHANPNNNYDYYAIDYRDAEPIAFMERGILYYVFPNGDFDFNTGNNNYIAKRGGMTTVNIDERGSRGIKIEHDYNGRVRRIGNTFINYDYYGRVKKIGNIYLTYNSFALTRIGNMRLYYNYHGEIVGVTGFINGNNYGYLYNPCPLGYNGSGFEEDTFENDADFYYYKKDGSKEKMKKEDIDGVKKDLAERKR